MQCDAVSSSTSSGDSVKGELTYDEISPDATATNTVPAGFPSLGSGPPTPVHETATSAPRRSRAPVAICRAQSSVTTGPSSTPSTSNFTGSW